VEHVPAVHVKVKDNLGSSRSDLAACASEVGIEGTEPKAESGGTRVELCRTVEDRRDSGNEERE
jgi:hypothetical protein